MKSLIKFSLAVIVILGVSACTSTPKTETQKPGETSEASALTEAEEKSYQQALVNIKGGDLDKAETSLRKLASEHSNHIGFWINLANVYYKKENMDRASDAITNAHRINSKNPEVYNLIGLIAAGKGEYKKAEKSYLDALSLNDNLATAHYNLALLYDIYYQDIGKAVTHYERYMSLIPDEDKDTSKWVEELKQTLKRRGNG
jgi:tetratricopeptide (TPR) repeat protein